MASVVEKMKFRVLPYTFAMSVVAALAASTRVPALEQPAHTQLVSSQAPTSVSRSAAYVIVNPGGLGGTQARSNSINNRGWMTGGQTWQVTRSSTPSCGYTVRLWIWGRWAVSTVPSNGLSSMNPGLSLVEPRLANLILTARTSA